MSQPKFLILTTNRTATGEPVYAPCGDVRELIAQWSDEADDWLEDETTLWPFELRKALADRFLRHADELEAALKPQGDLVVARPLQIGVEYPKEEVKP